MNERKILKTGGPAFPSGLQPDGSFHKTPSGGLSKRELFAALAMQAELIGNCLINKESGSAKDLASDAVDLADALLAALEVT